MRTFNEEKHSTSANKPDNLVEKGLSDNTTAIYVHGLASGANATTYSKIAKAIPHFAWIAEDFGEELAKNAQQLENTIATCEPELIVGTSMGGLTVLYADAPNAVKIVINPALSIADCVRHTIGLGKHPFFCKRLDGATEFELTEEMCCAYEEYIATHRPQLGRENYAIFAAHDELLGDEATIRAQKILAECGYKILIDPDGAHRIQPSTLLLISEIIG